MEFVAGVLFESDAQGNPAICKVCDQRPSEEVDHITPLSQGGDPWALDNLQGICSPCHWAKTARENAAGGGSLEPEASQRTVRVAQREKK
jgi:5-methylcytosine-specific restriction endonuclease McrA